MITKNIINTDRGMILFMVLSIILVVVALANIILMLVSSQFRLTQHQVARIQAHYAAQAGMNLAFENLRRGAWGTGSYSLCSSGCTVNDNTMPYRVNINIGNPGSGIDGTRQIRVTTTYTYTP